MIHETFSHYNIWFIRHRACCGNEEKHFFLRASAPNFSHSPNARVHARVRRFSFFAFTSSPFGCISLKISVLWVKVSLFGKTSYLPIAQWLMGEGSCLHPQRAVIQLIAEVFNTCLQGEAFTCKVFVISWLWTKMHAVKAEKRKLAVCA